MGRTIPPFRIALEQEYESWENYRKALSGGSKKTITDLFNAARNRCSAASNAVRPVRFEAIFMAIVLDHELRLQNIADEIEKIRLESSVGD